MNYNNIKLGLFDKFKVYQEKKSIAKNRKILDEIEGEISEIDYTSAIELEKELLKRKKIRIAYKEGLKLYKQNNNGLTKKQFLEKYFIENGLLEYSISETKSDQVEQKKDSNESQNESYHQKHNEDIYIKINNNYYKTSYIFSLWYFGAENQKNNYIPIELNDKGIYVINDELMSLEEKYKMLLKIINTILSEMGEDYAVLENCGQLKSLDKGPEAPFPTLCRKCDYICYVAKKYNSDGENIKAVETLEKLAEMVFNFNEERINLEEQELNEKKELI